MSLFRQDPGPCIICGAPHCSCGGGPIEVVQLPLRDAAIAAAVVASSSDSPVVSSTPLVADTVQQTLPPGSFTSGTYRGTKGPRRR